MKTIGLAGAVATVLMSLAVASNSASAQEGFKCEPGETYVMNVMVSAHP